MVRSPVINHQAPWKGCRLAALVVLLLLNPADAAIMGPTDDRRVPRFSEDESAFSATGRVICNTQNGQHSATATLLDTPGQRSRYFLTVAHAFVNSDTREKYRDCKFSIPRIDSSFPVRIKRTGDVLLRGWDGDWAVGQLPDSPLLKQVMGMTLLSVNPYEFINEAVVQLQYDTQSKRILLADQCRIYRMQLWNLHHGKNVFIHDCDVRSGGSGGPLVVKIKNSFQIIGIYLGTESRNRYYETEAKPDYSLFDPESFVNVARRIGREIQHAINELDKLE